MASEVESTLIKAELAAVEERLRVLATNETLSARDRELYRGYYTHERDKLRLEIAVQTHGWKVRSCEQELRTKREAVDFAKSDGGRLQARRRWNNLMLGRALGGGTQNPYQLAQYSDTPEEDAVRGAAREFAQAEESLRKARTDLEAQSSALERLRAQNADWEQLARKLEIEARECKYAQEKTRAESLRSEAAEAPPSAGAKQSDSREPSVTEVAPGAAEVKVLVDTLATPAEGARLMKAALRKKLPYRSVKDYSRIKDAIEHKKKTGCTFTKASEAIFGDRSMGRKIAYHYNRLKRGEQ